MSPDEKNPQDEAVARQQRAARLRAQIEEMKKGTARPLSPPAKTPREFVEEKGRGVSAKKRRRNTGSQ